MKKIEDSQVYKQIREELVDINNRIDELKIKSLALRCDIQMLLEKYQKEDNND